jgi:hypothetical protein
MEHLNGEEKKLLHDIREETETETEEVTTNGVF